MELQAVKKEMTMRKSCFLFLVATLLMVGVSFAVETPRESTSAEGKTGLTNAAVSGIDQAGVPGYIELVIQEPYPPKGIYRWYLYVTPAGNLMIASSTTLSTTGVEGKPITTPWYSGATPLGSVVGGQS